MVKRIENFNLAAARVQRFVDKHKLEPAAATHVVGLAAIMAEAEGRIVIEVSRGPTSVSVAIHSKAGPA